LCEFLSFIHHFYATLCSYLYEVTKYYAMALSKDNTNVIFCKVSFWLPVDEFVLRLGFFFFFWGISVSGINQVHVPAIVL